MKLRHAIGIDIGGTKIESAVIADDATVTQVVRHHTPATALETAELILTLTQDLRGKQPDVCGVGFSIPGSIDLKTRLLRNAPNSPTIHQTKFFDELAARLPLPMKCENDANCLVLSESLFGVAKGYRHVVGIIMGTGVGSGVLIDGKLLHGAHGLAPELGHSILDANGRLCLCGNQGCVEAYLSGPSILARYREAGGTEVFEQATEIFSSHGTVAKIIAEETLELFSRFVAMIVSLYDPEIVVLGGGLSKEKSYYDCGAKIGKSIFGSRTPPFIKPAQHGDASGKLGAAALFFSDSIAEK